MGRDDRRSHSAEDLLKRRKFVPSLTPEFQAMAKEIDQICPDVRDLNKDVFKLLVRAEPLTRLACIHPEGVGGSCEEYFFSSEETFTAHVKAAKGSVGYMGCYSCKENKIKQAPVPCISDAKIEAGVADMFKLFGLLHRCGEMSKKGWSHDVTYQVQLKRLCT